MNVYTRGESAGVLREIRHGISTILTLGAIVAGGFFSGYYVGKKHAPESVLPQLRGTPVAQGYLDIPNEYRPEVRLNAAGQREPILRHTSGLELKMIDALPRLITSYERNPAALERAMQEESYALVK